MNKNILVDVAERYYPELMASHRKDRTDLTDAQIVEQFFNGNILVNIALVEQIGKLTEAVNKSYIEKIL